MVEFREVVFDGTADFERKVDVRAFGVAGACLICRAGIVGLRSSQHPWHPRQSLVQGFGGCDISRFLGSRTYKFVFSVNAHIEDREISIEYLLCAVAVMEVNVENANLRMWMSRLPCAYCQR